MEHFKLLNNLCQSSIDSEYSVHYKYFSSATLEDWVCVIEISSYIKKRMNLFCPRGKQNIVNNTTGVAV